MLMTLLVGAALAASSHHMPDALQFRKAAGVPVRVIQVDLTDPNVHLTVQTAQGFPRMAESFGAMLARSRPTIAINGTYFSKMTLEPIGSIVVGGQMRFEGFMGTALAVTRDNQAIIRRVNRGHTERWPEFETVLGCGPALVLHGRVDVQPEAEGFQDPHVMGATRRMGVGLTADRHLLLVTTLAPVTFRQWAEVMHALGCTDAMNLDAGASLAMYYRGRTLIHPGRPLTNLLLVYVDTNASPTSASQANRPAHRPLLHTGRAGQIVTVRLCADTLRRATRWCPVTLDRRMQRGDVPDPCRVHHSPPGE